MACCQKLHSFSGWFKLSKNIHRDMYITQTVWCRSCTIDIIWFKYRHCRILVYFYYALVCLCVINPDIHRHENMSILPMYGVYYIGQVNIWVCISYSVNLNALRCQSESMRAKIRRSRFFFNITRRQAILPVAKFHHVLGRGFMIQRVILIFIKCLSANQNQLLYIYICRQTVWHKNCQLSVYCII